MGIFAKKQPLPDDVDGLLAYAEKPRRQTASGRCCRRKRWLHRICGCSGRC